MKIIILGAGQVGGSLAEILIGENHDITLVDRDEDRLQYFADRLDIRTIVGHCSYPGILRQAGADSADMVIAVTDNDEANIVACQVAYTLFNVPTKMARIRSRHYFVRKDVFTPDHIPIDVLVSPENIVTKLIAELLEMPGALRSMPVGDGIAKIISIRPDLGSTVLGKTLNQVYQQLAPIEFKIIAIFRGSKLLDLTQEIELHMSDRVYLVARTEHLNQIIAEFRQEVKPFERIMIAGGGNIGSNLARVLQNKKSVKIIDHNRRHCEHISHELNDTTVLCGDVNDSTLLIDEQIESVDAFLAVTNDDEANIIGAIQAKHLGARQTFALINRNDYFNVIEPGIINVRISPSLTTMGAILKHVRQGDIKTVFPIRRGQAEIIEAVVHGDRKTSRLADRTIGEVKFPSMTSIVAIIRDKEFILTSPETKIKSSDRVVLFVADKEFVGDTEKLLEVSTGFF